MEVAEQQVQARKSLADGKSLAAGKSLAEGQRRICNMA